MSAIEGQTTVGGWKKWSFVGAGIAVEGFTLFDDATHYSIIFPKPTGPTPADREKFIKDMLKK